jgi:hypothetical protein
MAIERARRALSCRASLHVDFALCGGARCDGRHAYLYHAVQPARTPAQTGSVRGMPLFVAGQQLSMSERDGCRAQRLVIVRPKMNVCSARLRKHHARQPFAAGTQPSIIR